MKPAKTMPSEVSMSAVLTFVLWTTACSISVIGVLIPYSRPQLAPKKEPAIAAETLQVQLTSNPVLDRPDELPRTTDASPPEFRTVTTPLEAPSFTAVADPAVVAFALPVEGPTRLVETKLAAFASPTEPVQTNAPVQAVPPPQQLTYGQGEGRQPAPEYPYKARREGQEGTVKVRFFVGEDGRVLTAETASASPWPLLNDSALRVVRERWRFRPGPIRNYEVAIRFQINR